MVRPAAITSHVAGSFSGMAAKSIVRAFGQGVTPSGATFCAQLFLSEITLENEEGFFDCATKKSSGASLRMTLLDCARSPLVTRHSPLLSILSSASDIVVNP